VVTTSGVIVTLVLALGGASTGTTSALHLTGSARDWMLAALALFVLAAGAALATNFPMRYEAVEGKEIESRLNEQPIRTRSEAELDVAYTRVKALIDAKKKNGTKGKLLFAAIALEVCAIAVVCVAIGQTAQAGDDHGQLSDGNQLSHESHSDHEGSPDHEGDEGDPDHESQESNPDHEGDESDSDHEGNSAHGNLSHAGHLADFNLRGHCHLHQRRPARS
jgi:hypothetical protein